MPGAVPTQGQDVMRPSANPEASIMPGAVPTSEPSQGSGINWAAGGEALAKAGGHEGLGEAAAKIAEAIRRRRG